MRSAQPRAETSARLLYHRVLDVRTIAKIAIPALLLGAIVYVRSSPFTAWTRFQTFALALALVVHLAVILRGRLRDAMVVVATLLLCLTLIEAYCVDALVTTSDIIAPDYTVPHPTLGWARGHAGVFHHIKRDVETGRVILDATYTIDGNLNRHVVSAEDGPTVAFYGGSDTFGVGLEDSDTLPQLFADATERHARVLNFGVAGYGPQQYLRALETGMNDDVLTRPRLIVYETIPWQAERTACINSYMRTAPRYELVGGQAVFQGACAERWSLPLRILWEHTSIYGKFVEPRLSGARPEKLDLYVAVLARAGQIARDKYGAPTAILYTPSASYLRPAGYTDEDMMRRLREAGLVVVDGTLDPRAFPGQTLEIPGEGHPTGAANRIWAERLNKVFAGLAPPSP